MTESEKQVPLKEHIAWLKGADKLQAILNEEMVRRAEQIGQELAKGQLTPTQMRNIFQQVQVLRHQFAQKFQADEVPLLKVRLVYMAAREREKVGPLVELLLVAIDKIGTDTEGKAAFDWFARFAEAILAYYVYNKRIEEEKTDEHRDRNPSNREEKADSRKSDHERKLGMPNRPAHRS